MESKSCYFVEEGGVYRKHGEVNTLSDTLCSGKVLSLVLAQCFSTGGSPLPLPGDIWQCLETFLVVTTENCLFVLFCGFLKIC